MGAIIGGVIGALVIVAVVVSIIFLVRKQREETDLPEVEGRARANTGYIFTPGADSTLNLNA